MACCVPPHYPEKKLQAGRGRAFAFDSAAGNGQRSCRHMQPARPKNLTDTQARDADRRLRRSPAP